MLILKNIIKDYPTGDTKVRALKGININFRENEFVSILGPSGCGKTTMLNLIGGLDKYTEGDLVINGKSTKEFTDADWDTYRNHSIGFVFQSYNLIPHQTVLSNVELALTLSGVSKKERRARAVEALKKVGLEEHLNKRPSQMSGGQMQRVAIARALVNNPDIILADEPTGALDTETSVQIMEILKEISADKLIIMVTHNPELAQRYSTRIISCLDGQIIGDTNPFVPQKEDYKLEREKAAAEKAKGKKPSMNWRTAFSLSLKNLFTKKGRTAMVAFAGSIGIVGIALVLAMRAGINNYIGRIESDALMMFPMSVEKQATNTDSLLETAMGLNPLMGVDHDTEDAVYINQAMTTLLNTFVQQSNSNNLGEFKKYIDVNADKFNELCSDIQFNYTVPLNIYRVDDGSNTKVNPSMLMDQLPIGDSMSSLSGFIDIDSYTNLWKQMVGDNQAVGEHYDVIYGRMPQAFNEVVVIVDGNNEINEFMAYALGMEDQSQMMSNLMKAFAGTTDGPTGQKERWTFEEICALKFKLLLNCDYMQKDPATGLWKSQANNPVFVRAKLENAVDISVVGVVKPNKDNVLNVGTGYIGFPGALMDYAIETSKNSEVVQAQLADTTTDVLSGEKFFDLDVNDFSLADIDLTKIDFKYMNLAPFMSMMEDIDLSQIDILNFDITDFIDFSEMTVFKKKIMEGFLSDEQVLAMKQAYIDTIKAQRSLENTYSVIGCPDEANPTSIFLYPKNFETKAEVNRMVDYYNEKMEADGHEELTINCTDYIGIVMNVASQAIDIVSITLIIFVAISLVVSSIMIGIITYVSVIERTKEIGILRAIGASKRDVSNVFNAETVIIGLAAGLFGILITIITTVPINLILKNMTGVYIGAFLPFVQGVALIAISMFLTFIAGLVPASMAAKKDPVVALRTE